MTDLKRITDILEEDSKLIDTSNYEFDDLKIKYPYFGLVYMLEAKAKKLKTDKEAESFIALASVYANDRKAFRRLLKSTPKAVPDLQKTLLQTHSVEIANNTQNQVSAAEVYNKEVEAQETEIIEPTNHLAKDNNAPVHNTELEIAENNKQAGEFDNDDASQNIIKEGHPNTGQEEKTIADTPKAEQEITATTDNYNISEENLEPLSEPNETDKEEYRSHTNVDTHEQSIIDETESMEWNADDKGYTVAEDLQTINNKEDVTNNLGDDLAKTNEEGFDTANPNLNETESTHDNYFDELLSYSSEDAPNSDLPLDDEGHYKRVVKPNNPVYEEQANLNPASRLGGFNRPWQITSQAQGDETNQPQEVAVKHAVDKLVTEEEIKKNLENLRENKKRFLADLEQKVKNLHDAETEDATANNPKNVNLQEKSEATDDLNILINPNFDSVTGKYLPNEAPINNFFMENAANKDDNTLEWQHKLLDIFIEVEQHKLKETGSFKKRPIPKTTAEQTDLSEVETNPHDIVSENMASILLAQGDKEGAKKIYTNLQLKFPDKKDYFAELIKNL